LRSPLAQDRAPLPRSWGDAALSASRPAPAAFAPALAPAGIHQRVEGHRGHDLVSLVVVPVDRLPEDVRHPPPGRVAPVPARPPWWRWHGRRASPAAGRRGSRSTAAAAPRSSPAPCPSCRWPSPAARHCPAPASAAVAWAKLHRSTPRQACRLGPIHVELRGCCPAMSTSVAILARLSGAQGSPAHPRPAGN
jgi:hypothetical protein